MNKHLIINSQTRNIEKFDITTTSTQIVIRCHKHRQCVPEIRDKYFKKISEHIQLKLRAQLKY